MSITRNPLSAKKKNTYLIAPFVDDGHVDVINEAGHLAPSWRAIRGTHTFIYITLNCALWRKHNYSGSKLV